MIARQQISSQSTSFGAPFSTFLYCNIQYLYIFSFTTNVTNYNLYTLALGICLLYFEVSNFWWFFDHCLKCMQLQSQPAIVLSIGFSSTCDVWSESPSLHMLSKTSCLIQITVQSRFLHLTHVLGDQLGSFFANSKQAFNAPKLSISKVIFRKRFLDLTFYLSLMAIFAF